MSGLRSFSPLCIARAFPALPGHRSLVSRRPPAAPCRHLVMGILWQIIKLGLLDDIDLEHCPELYRLLNEGETIEQLMALKPEEILLRWFNFHLEAAGSTRRVSNFSSDVCDSECYTVLLGQISKGTCTQEPMSETDMEARATKMLAEAGKIDCDKLVTPGQVVAGNPRLNLAFTANLFNTCPGLEPLVEEEKVVVEQAALLEVEPEDEGDSREERAFRSWFNSLNIDREVLDLYEQIGDGIILLQAEDKLRPGIVDWASTYPMPKEVVHAATNCNFAVDYGKQLGCQLVNIGGKDIVDGNRKLILGLSWQLMRMSIFQMLAELEFNGAAVDEAGLLAWANSKVGDKAPPITSFQDKGLTDGKFLLHMLDGVRPEAVDWDEVKSGEGELSDDDKHENASYMINIARKIGCKVFLTWEDVVEAQPKMITTLLAAALIVEQAPSEEELRAKQEDAELAARVQAAEDARKLAESKAKVAELEEKKKAEDIAAAQELQKQASTAKEQAVADKAAAKSKMTVKAKKTKARAPPKGALDMTDPALEEAFQKVSDDADDTDWAWFGLTGDGTKMKLMETGDDGLEGAVDELDDCRVMFGYVRCIMPDGRPKFVAITWAGPSASEQVKGKISSYKGQIEDFLDPNHLHVMAREEDDIEEEEIMAKLTKSGGASY